MITIIYVTIINISYNMRNPEKRTRCLRRLLIKIKNRYPSEDNVTMYHYIVFGLASGRIRTSIVLRVELILYMSMVFVFSERYDNGA